LEALAFLLSFWASGRPNSPFSPCGRRVEGGMRGKRAPEYRKSVISQRTRIEHSEAFRC
jgi:hypothetical protein